MPEVIENQDVVSVITSKAKQTRKKSVVLTLTVSNNSEKGRRSIYSRLIRYSKDKGVTAQDSIRKFIAEMLDKTGY